MEPAAPVDRHFPGFHVRMVIDYVQSRLGSAGVAELLGRSGEERDLVVLLDDGAWHSYGQFRRLLEAAAEILGGKQELLGIGPAADAVGGNMPEVAAMLQSFGSPSAMFASMANGEAGVSTVTVGSTEQVGPAEWLLHSALVDGFEPFPELCAFISAISAVGVRLFGLEPTGTVEEECQCRGDPRCTIRLTWAESDDRDNQLEYTRNALKIAQSSLESFQQIVGELVATDDLDSVLERIMSMSSRAMRAPSFVLALEPLRWTTRRVYWAGASEFDAMAIAERIFAGDDRVGMVAEVTSARRHHGQLVAFGPHGTVPPNEAPLLQAYARIAATALDSACALEEARRQADTARALLELSTSLSEIASADELASRVVRAMPAVIDCDCSAMMLVDEAGVARIAARHGLADRVVNTVNAVGFPVGGAHGVTVRTPGSSPEATEFMQLAGLAAMATAPVLIDGAPLGVLIAGVTHEPSRLIDEPMLTERFSGLAGQAAVALRNGRLVDHIRHQSMHDPLTGLPNRALIIDRAEQMLARARRSHGACAAFFLDLDGFKEINDTLGHRAGDALLCSVAGRLATAVRGNDTVGRLGGDEFVVLSDGPSLNAEPELVADRLLDVLRAPFELTGRDRPLLVTASIGIALGVRTSADELLRDADIALYCAKASGKNRFQIFAAEMQTAVTERADLTTSVQQALDRHEFTLVYKPIFDQPSDNCTGFEAFLKWHHPQRGVIGPDSVTPLIEDTGLLLDVGRWMLKEACRQAAEWHSGGRSLNVSINMSLRQIERHDFIDQVRLALAESGLPAKRLLIQIPETAIMRDARSVSKVLRSLKALGVRIVINDFGTAYASLAYLEPLPVDALKINRTFIHATTDATSSAALVHTLVSFGKALHLEILAEGSDHVNHPNKLRGGGFDNDQGHPLAEPMTPDAVSEFLKEAVPIPLPRKMVS